jgi:hypothetical protein
MDFALPIVDARLGLIDGKTFPCPRCGILLKFQGWEIETLQGFIRQLKRELDDLKTGKV